jgi:hypothetical protein
MGMSFRQALGAQFMSPGALEFMKSREDAASKAALLEAQTQLEQAKAKDALFGADTSLGFTDASLKLPTAGMPLANGVQGPTAPKRVPNSIGLADFEKQNDWHKQVALQKLAMGVKGNMGETPGRKSADQAFGKEYADWSSNGLPQAEKSIQALEQAKNTLMTDPSITGSTVGKLPDWARTYTNPEAVNVKETIRQAVQSSLKATLGAQFTEKEGERIFNFAYNPSLPAKQNVQRLDRLIKELTSMKDAKQSMSDYFEQKGSITGWKGRPVSSASIGIDQPEQGGDNRKAQLDALYQAHKTGR